MLPIAKGAHRIVNAVPWPHISTNVTRPLRMPTYPNFELLELGVFTLHTVPQA